MTTATDTISDAMGMLRKDYWNMIRSHAEDLAAECKDGDIPDTDALHERMHEDCDSMEWVIYTFKAQLVLLCSDNADAGIEEMGADGFDWSAGIPWSQLAYFAVQQDIYEHLDALGLDVNDDSEWQEDDDDND